MAQLHPRFQRTVALESERKLDPYIERYVDPGARVIDLGCGSGDLLARLIANRDIHARGVEISSEGVKACIEKGLSVYQGDLDDGFKDFDAGVFDVVILNLTLAMLHNPDLVLSEVVRIGKRAIVTFYNAGYFPLREKFFASGETSALHPENAEWYRASQIHPFSVQDFIALCKHLGLDILGRTHLSADFQPLIGAEADDPQKWAFAAVYVVVRCA